MAVASELQACYRHGDQRAGVVCQRCDRPICPRCMHTASVGFHCPECVKQGGQKVYRGVAALQIRPVLTQVLIGINVAVFAVGILLSGTGAVTGSSGDLTVDGGLIAEGCVEAVRGADGIPVCLDQVGVAQGEWYRVLTSGFLHSGWIHLGFNMYALWILGGMLERSVGRLRFGAIYLTSLLAGALGVLLLSPNQLTVGASGAVFGMMGAVFAIQRTQGISFRDSPLFGVLMLNLLITFAVPRISIGGHLGGLVGGFLAGFVLFDLAGRATGAGRTPAGTGGPVATRRNAGQQVGLALCAALAVALAIGSVVVAYGAA